MIAGSSLASRFTPLSIAGCVLWCDGDTGSVSSWTDQSGTGHHLVQATGSKQPTIVTNVVNGHSAYRFDGVDDVMQAAFTLVQPETVFLVCRSVVIGAAGSDALVDGVNNLSMFCGNDTTPQTQLYNGVSLPFTGNVSNKRFACVTCVFNGASSALRSKGAQLVAGNAGNGTAAGGVSIGCAGAGGRPAQTDYMHVSVFPSALSAANIASMEAYLTQRFSL